MSNNFVLNCENDLTLDDVITKNDKIQPMDIYLQCPNQQMIDKFLKNCVDMGYGQFENSF